MIKKILFIRRDNIGDLICTTPAIHAARERFPQAKICALVNTYNAAALEGNPDIDGLYVYEKAKHSSKNKASVIFGNMRLLMKIRREHFDVAIGCGSYSSRLERYTRLTGAAMRIGYIKEGTEGPKGYNAALTESEGPLHEVERTFMLLSGLGINSAPPAMKVYPSAGEMKKVVVFMSSSGIKQPVIAFHISSRKPDNRWPIDKFIELGRLVRSKLGADVMLLWSPGSEGNVYHPGDDEKAAAVTAALGPQTAAYKTESLAELIAALSASDLVVCCDGGAMHIAAALGKPVVTIWGSTSQDRWRPWGTDYVILQDKTKKAGAVSVEDVFEGLKTVASRRSLIIRPVSDMLL
ncbi:MAG: glycosyltransferase family 9 protein [Nitrospirae bacterium]|nr:MAG: glycosyltransferase family 9 protein [Nitrospirota bacterium]